MNTLSPVRNALAACSFAIPVFGAACGSAGPAIVAERAVIVIPAGDAPAAMYFSVRNTGSAPDTLLALSTGVATTATMHNQESRDMPMGPGGAMGAMMHMVSVPLVAIPGHSELHFSPGGYHGMLEGLRQPLVRGDTVRVTLRLAHAGEVSALARIVAYADLDSATAPSPSSQR